MLDNGMSQASSSYTMSSTAMALDYEYDEVPVSSIEVLEANVAAIRDGLMEFKTEVRTALANAEKNPNARMLTPLVLEIIAEKL